MRIIKQISKNKVVFFCVWYKAAAANTLEGKDEYCMDYITGVRAGKIKA